MLTKLLHVKITNDNNTTAKALMLVYQSKKGNWQHVIFGVSTINTLDILDKQSDDVQPIVSTIGNYIFNTTVAQSHTTVPCVNGYHFKPNQIEVINTLTTVYNSSLIKGISEADVTAKDSNNQELTDYILSVAGKVSIPTKKNTPTTRKLAFKSREVDWNKTWNSPDLTDEEKAYLRVKLDLNIYKADRERESYKIMSHILETEYPDHPWVAIGLHGDPASGKTTAIETYAAAHNAPILYIACSSILKIQKLLAKTTPLQLENSKEAQLSVVETIWLKCFEHNLPLIINLDEFNLLDIQETNALAPIITGNKVMVDALGKGCKNDNTMFYVASWNPNTSFARSLDEKMYDRFFFVNFENIDPKIQKSFKQDLTVSALLGLVDEEKADLYKGVPQEIQDFIKNNCTPDASEAAIKAFIQEKTQPRVVTIKEKEFSDHHLSDITIGSRDEMREAIGAIEGFRTLLSNTLYDKTKGKDIKQPDKNFGYYIPYRSSNYFADLIFQYSNVETATKRFVSDLLPGGHTLKGLGSDDVKVDDAPQKQANEIAIALSSHIQTLQQKLFNTQSLEYIEKDICKNQARVSTAFVAEMLSSISTNGTQTKTNIDASVSNIINQINSINGGN